jgi:predicted ATP-dependent endonuclease of OLD family
VLLDEPASSLHGDMQTALLREIRARHGNKYIVATHAPARVPSEALSQVSRFYQHCGNTVHASLDVARMDRKATEKLHKELRHMNARALLFARAVLLVEGDTELGALPVWYEKEFHESLWSKDIALHKVGALPTPCRRRVGVVA